MSQKKFNKSLPSAHSGFSKGSLGPYVMIIIIISCVCDNNHGLTIVTQLVGMARRGNRVL